MAPRIDADLQLKVMTEIGVLRSRSLHRAFVVAWPLSALVLFGIGLGLVLDLIIGSLIAAAVSRAWVKGRKEDIIVAACSKFGVGRNAFAPEQYILD